MIENFRDLDCRRLADRHLIEFQTRFILLMLSVNSGFELQAQRVGCADGIDPLNRINESVSGKEHMLLPEFDSLLLTDQISHFVNMLLVLCL